jgi:antitoxin (DNA-binding transcriptional repressor) of toxin-antitoxin stability system
VEEGEEVVITRRGQPVARVVREHPQSCPSHDWPARLRALHSDAPQPAGSAFEAVAVGSSSASDAPWTRESLHERR